MNIRKAFNIITECYFILLFVINSTIIAAPLIDTIEGDVSHGGQVVLTGYSFGNKASAQPIKYNDFEGLNEGERLPDADPWWTDRGNVSYMAISTLNQRHNRSLRNAEAHMAWNVRAAHAWKNDIGFATTGKAFVSMWIRAGETQENEDNNGYQIKLFRLPVRVEDANTIYPDMALFHWFYEGDNNDPVYFQNHGSVSTGYFAKRSIVKDANWYQVSLQLEMGTPGGGNGRWISWHSSTNFGDVYQIQDEFWPDPSYEILGSSNEKIDAFYFHGYLGNCEGDIGTPAWVKLYYDDVYIDNSWARVEIGDNQKYEFSTHREIQIPTAWVENVTPGTDQITITANRGSFAPCETFYLFVIDSDGNVSDQDAGTPGAQGFPIKIVTGAGEPCPPTGLQILQ